MLNLMNITAGYGEHTVLRELSLAFEPGMLHAVVGKNGCGKSTLLQVCAGAIVPASGERYLCGKPLEDYVPRDRARQISCLSQKRTVPNITVERLVLHGRYPYLPRSGAPGQEDAATVVRVLEQLQISQLADSCLTHLSGGECQRAFLAMLLAQDTPVVLLDEPMTHLDVEYQLLVMKLLRQLAQQGKTVVAVLHDLAQALEFCDLMHVMDGGRVVFSGSPEAVVQSDVLSNVFHVRLEQNGWRFSEQAASLHR